MNEFGISHISNWHTLLQVVLTGSLKGSGRQYVGAALVFIAYYIIGLPLGIVLALKLDLGALGLWTGMACGNFFHVSG